MDLRATPYLLRSAFSTSVSDKMTDSTFLTSASVSFFLFGIIRIVLRTSRLCTAYAGLRENHAAFTAIIV